MCSPSSNGSLAFGFEVRSNLLVVLGDDSDGAVDDTLEPVVDRADGPGWDFEAGDGGEVFVDGGHVAKHADVVEFEVEGLGQCADHGAQ